MVSKDFLRVYNRRNIRGKEKHVDDMIFGEVVVDKFAEVPHRSVNTYLFKLASGPI